MSSVVQSPVEILKTFRDKAYKNRAPVDALKAEQTKGYLVSKFEIDNGIFVHYDGMEFPERSPALAEDLYLANYAKRMLMAMFRYLSKQKLFVLWFILVPYKWKIKALNELLLMYTDTNILVVRAMFLKDEYLSPISLELKHMSHSFLVDLGINPKNADEFAEIFANLINLDNAYRYRLHDLFMETRPQRLLAQPIREIWKLLKINQERDPCSSVKGKFRLVVIGVTILLLYPRFRRAFKRSILNCNYKQLLPQDMDKFWMNVRSGYNFFGKTDQERKMDINHLKVCKPITIKV
jgi:hypothetical protein